MNEVEKIEAREEGVLILSGFNKHVRDIIPGNYVKVSPGVELVRDFLASGKYVLVNSLAIVTGGPFTRFDQRAPKTLEKISN